jgi:hypothetical protein
MPDNSCNKEKSMYQLSIAVSVLIVISAILFAGQGDYEEAVAEEARYCQRVELGVHRDFNENINCKKESK